MLMRVLQLILLEEGETKMRERVEDAIAAANRRKASMQREAAE